VAHTAEGVVISGAHSDGHHHAASPLCVECVCAQDPDRDHCACAVVPGAVAVWSRVHVLDSRARVFFVIPALTILQQVNRMFFVIVLQPVGQRSLLQSPLLILFGKPEELDRSLSRCLGHGLLGLTVTLSQGGEHMGEIHRFVATRTLGWTLPEGRRRWLGV
jgi:hypothetical protein